jgi:anti-sigma regulatory factor (Ser/Thr protein kinase)
MTVLEIVQDELRANIYTHANNQNTVAVEARLTRGS